MNSSQLRVRQIIEGSDLVAAGCRLRHFYTLNKKKMLPNLAAGRHIRQCSVSRWIRTIAARRPAGWAGSRHPPALCWWHYLKFPASSKQMLSNNWRKNFKEDFQVMAGRSLGLLLVEGSCADATEGLLLTSSASSSSWSASSSAWGTKSVCASVNSKNISIFYLVRTDI